MGNIRLVDQKEFQHAPNHYEKGAKCKGEGFDDHVGWETGHYFMVDLSDTDKELTGLRDSGNLMVAMEGTRYDITFREEDKIEKVVTVKFKEMFRIGSNNRSELLDVHWKTRRNPPVCGILSIATLPLSLYKVKWKSSDTQEEYEQRESEYYGRRSGPGMAPVACNANDSDEGGRGYIEGSLDDPHYRDVDRSPVPGYSGVLKYPPFFPWHCSELWTNMSSYLDWSRKIISQLHNDWKIHLEFGPPPFPSIVNDRTRVTPAPHISISEDLASVVSGPTLAPVRLSEEAGPSDALEEARLPDKVAEPTGPEVVGTIGESMRSVT